MNHNAAVINKSKLFALSDVPLGEQYQHISNKNSNKVTLIVYSDGTPIVRSSKKSLWSCFASTTEISQPMREFQSNIIVLALWLARKKPDVTVFLEVTISEFSLLIQNRTTVFIGDKECKIELDTQLFISDLPAKALFCCTNYFNGYSASTFSCSRGKSSFFLFKKYCSLRCSKRTF